MFDALPVLRFLATAGVGVGAGASWCVAMRSRNASRWWCRRMNSASAASMSSACALKWCVISSRSAPSTTGAENDDDAEAENAENADGDGDDDDANDEDDE